MLVEEREPLLLRETTTRYRSDLRDRALAIGAASQLTNHPSPEREKIRISSSMAFSEIGMSQTLSCAARCDREFELRLREGHGGRTIPKNRAALPSRRYWTPTILGSLLSTGRPK